MTRTNQPNILLIMADQFRYDYMGCMGAEHVRTPNLDRLAAEGTLMRNCFTNAPVCTPARIGLATGLQPFRTGALDNDAYLPLRTPTYYKQLRDHGYRVGCVGKLDLAKPSKYNGRYGDRPCVFGWGFTHPEECEGKMHAGSRGDPLGPYTYYLKEKGLLEAFQLDYEKRRKAGWLRGASEDSVLPAEDFEDAYIGARACRWIGNIPDDFPFHLFVSFVGPHDPYDPPAEYAEATRNRNMPEAVTHDGSGKPAYVTKKMQKCGSPDEIRTLRRQYCAAVELIDAQIGRILDALEQRGMRENTYILFTSDHGEMLGDLGLFTKHVPYEASLRVPLIASGPGIRAGCVSDAMTELIDVNPTICELAGVDPLRDIDARSFVPVLQGETSSHRKDVLSGLRHFRCVRTERYKYIDNINDIEELYDLQDDPHETCNIVRQNPEAAAELKNRLHARQLEGTWLRG